MDRAAFVRTMRTLERAYPIQDWSAGMTPFEVLVSTILSQSTTAANERRGMDGLREAFAKVTPDIVAAANERAVAQAIWHAGLARQKAPRIREVARQIRDEWGGDVSRILELPLDRARAALTALPGVGPKTADVVLAMAANRPVFPVDTHVARIAGRWRIGRGRTYEEIRQALETWTPPETRKAWHLALIAHGRDVCKAGKPRCDLCPVSRDCDWYHAHRVRAKSERKKSRMGEPRS